MTSRLLALTITATVALGSVFAAGCGGDSADATESKAANCLVAVQGLDDITGPEYIGSVEEQDAATRKILVECPTPQAYMDALRKINPDFDIQNPTEPLAAVTRVTRAACAKFDPTDDLPLCKATAGE